MRIVSLDPTITEFLKTLGVEDQIVGHDFLSVPNSDVIFTTPKVDKELRVQLQSKYKVVHIDPINLVQVFQDINHIGRVLGREDKTNALVESMKSQMLAIRERVKDAEKRKVVVQYKDKIVGRWIPKMIELAGGISILKEGKNHTTFNQEDLFGCVVIDYQSDLFRIGSRLAEGVELIAREIHPDRF